MKTLDTTIRLETPADYAAVEHLVRECFWNVYRPGCLEHYVLHRLRTEPDFIPELAFVMEQDGRIIGQNVFVKAKIDADDGRTIPILAMGPIGILPSLQRKGYGKMLLDATMEKARSASRATSPSTARAASTSPPASGSGITVCPTGRTRPSFSAGS